MRSVGTRQGFTLVELSIVLVIIGLLIGGILVGRDLIEAAMLRAQVSQIDKLKAAAYSFKLKFGSLPGDISATNATAVGLTASLGDEDGFIDGAASSTVEAFYFFYHLQQANLFSCSGNPCNTIVRSRGHGYLRQ